MDDKPEEWSQRPGADARSGVRKLQDRMNVVAQALPGNGASGASNENTNRMIRRFIPKGSDISKCTRTAIQEIDEQNQKTFDCRLMDVFRSALFQSSPEQRAQVSLLHLYGYMKTISTELQMERYEKTIFK